jgi:hypothetical protein
MPKVEGQLGAKHVPLLSQAMLVLSNATSFKLHVGNGEICLGINYSVLNETKQYK